MEQKSAKENIYQQIGNGRTVTSSNKSMASPRVLVNNNGNNQQQQQQQQRYTNGNNKAGSPPAIPTSSREAQLHYYPWKATDANTSTGGGANQQQQHQASLLRQPQQYSSSSANNAFSSLINHQTPSSNNHQTVSFAATTKPSPFSSSTTTETYENVPANSSPNSSTSSSVPFLNYISLPYSTSSANENHYRNQSNIRPVTAMTRTSTTVSIGPHHHAMSTVPPLAVYTGENMTASMGSNYHQNVPARLLPASLHHHHHHHHNHIQNLLGGDMLSSYPNTSATFLSSSKDARVGFHSGNTPPHSPTINNRDGGGGSDGVFDMPGSKSDENTGRTSRGSVAERVLWFEGFPQTPSMLSSNKLTGLPETESGDTDGGALQVIHYTTHEHRGPERSGSTSLVRSRSRRTAPGYAVGQGNRESNSPGYDDRFASNLTERTIPSSGSSLPPPPSSLSLTKYNLPQQQTYALSQAEFGSSIPANDYRPAKSSPLSNGTITNNFRSPASFSTGLQEATFSLSTTGQPRIVPISTETVFGDTYYSAANSPYQQPSRIAQSHPRLQQSLSVSEHQQPQLPSGLNIAAGPGSTDAAQERHYRSQSIPALTSQPTNLHTTHPPSPYLASYKRQHEQLQRTGLQQILDSLDFNKLIDEVHGRAFRGNRPILSPLDSPAYSTPPSLLAKPSNFGSPAPFSQTRQPSWTSRPFHTHQQPNNSLSGAKGSPSLTAGNENEASLFNADPLLSPPPPPPPRRLSSAARSLMLSDEHWPFASSFGFLNHHSSLLQPVHANATDPNNVRRNTVERTIPILVSDGPATPMRTAASRNKTPPPPSAVAAAVAAAAKQKLIASALAGGVHQQQPADEVIAPSPSSVLTQQQQQHHCVERVLPTSLPSPAILQENAHLHHNTLSSAVKEATGAPLHATAAGMQPVSIPVVVPLNSTGTGRQSPPPTLKSTASALYVPIPTPNTQHQPKLHERQPGKPLIAAAITTVALPAAANIGGLTGSNNFVPLTSDNHNNGSTANAVTAALAKTIKSQDQLGKPTVEQISHRLPHHPYAATGKVNTNKYSSSSIIIPRFYYPRGKPTSSDIDAEFNEYVMREKLQRYFQGRHEMYTLKDMAIVAKVVQVPHYWKAALFKAFGGVKETDVVSEDIIVSTWKRMVHHNFDEEARFVALLAKPGTHHLEPSDFALLIQDIVEEHPGLNILKEAPEFHARYINTVISRIYFEINRSWSGKITICELRRSKLMQVLRTLEKENDINLITDFFSYEHFYVIYCKFWELDQDHDLIINREDLARHHEGAMNPLIVDRIFSGAVTRGEHQKRGQMNYPEFVWFLLAEEDKRNPRSIEYWFRCMDLDGDGYLTLYELEYFYAKQAERMKELGLEPLAFSDIATQMFDMIKPKKHPRLICLSDLKRNVKLTPIFFDTFTNLEKYILHEHRDPFANSKHLEDPELEGLSDWCKYAAEEYEYLVSEEAASNGSSANDTPTATPTNFTTLTSPSSAASSNASLKSTDEAANEQPNTPTVLSNNTDNVVLGSDVSSNKPFDAATAGDDNAVSGGQLTVAASNV